MELVGLLHSLSTFTCGGAFLIWVSIAPLSRTEGGEVVAQRVMTILCFTAAVSLFALYFAGGSLFGSPNLARILAVVSFAVGVSATMNIKGKDVQGEANPHQMMRLKREDVE